MNRNKLEQRRARRREHINRLDKIALYNDKILMLRARIDDQEEREEPDATSIRSMKARIRTLEQQIKYMS